MLKSRWLKFTTLFLLLASAPLGASAQVRPIPEQRPTPAQPNQRPSAPQRPTTPPSQTNLPPTGTTPTPQSNRPNLPVNPPNGVNAAVPRANIAVFNPSFSVGFGMRSAFPINRRIVGVPLKLSGLYGMRSAHIFALEPGCRFGGLMRGPSNSILGRLQTSTGMNVYTSEQMGNDDWDIRRLTERPMRPYRFRVPERAGYTVQPDGTVEFSLLGWANVPVRALRFDNDTIGGTLQNPGADWAPYLFDATPTQSGNDVDEVCQPRAIIAVQGQDDIWRIQDEDGTWKVATEVTRPKLIEGQPWLAQGTRNVTITNTWRLRDVLSVGMFKNHNVSLSQCSGISDNFSGKFPVGIVNRGGKLAFVIRSGQIPTDCIYTLGPADLPPGVGIAEMTFRLEKVGDKCGPTRGSWGRNMADFVQRAVFPPGEEWFTPIEYAYSEGGFTGYNVFDTRATGVLPGVRLWPLNGGRDTPTYVVPDASVHAIGNPYALAQGQDGNERRDVLKPLLGMLSCDITGSNDNEAAIILESVKATVPHGVTF